MSLTSRARRERGVAAVEFALILPVFVLLLFGTITLARAWNVHNVLDHAAREAARLGATEPWGDTSASQNAAENILRSAGVDPSDPDVHVHVAFLDGGSSSSFGNCETGTGDDERVFVCVEYRSYDLEFIFFSQSVTLSAPATARHES